MPFSETATTMVFRISDIKLSDQATIDALAPAPASWPGAPSAPLFFLGTRYT